jgi:hypothetical protein
MHPNVIQEAIKLDRNIDLPMWLSSLSLDDKAVPFYKQKDMECAWLEKQISGPQCAKITPKFITKRPFRNISEDDDQVLVKLMDDIVTRIEEKAFQEEHYTQKISEMRSKLRSAKGSKGASDKLEVV